MWVYHLSVAVGIAIQIASLPPASAPPAPVLTHSIPDHLPSLEPIKPRLLPPRKRVQNDGPIPPDPAGRQRSGTGFID
jgi:hypothetical protein